MLYRNLSNEEFTMETMIERMKETIFNYIGESFRIIIGSDSQYHSDETCFVTAVILYRVGKGANVFYHKSYIQHDIDICTRIMKETSHSIELMGKIQESDLGWMIGKNDYEIHIDAGENGDSRRVLKECMSYVQAMGYKCQSKPGSSVASHVADRFTK
jgi:predicted RNase H-related nuclease YkuK (DUF458 family)